MKKKGKHFMAVQTSEHHKNYACAIATKAYVYHIY